MFVYSEYRLGQHMARKTGSKKPRSVKRRSTKKLLKNLQPAGLIFTGMVRPAEGDSRAVMFARPGGSRWIKLHKDQIEDMKLVQSAHSGKKSYPLVHLVMRPAQSAEAKAYAGLAQLHNATATAADAGPLCWDSERNVWGPCPSAR